jgi:hypothetical protein
LLDGLWCFGYWYVDAWILNSSAIDFFSSGRTTFVNTLCGKKVLQGKDADDATNAHLEESVRIKPITVGAYHLIRNHISIYRY